VYPNYILLLNPTFSPLLIPPKKRVEILKEEGLHTPLGFPFPEPIQG